MSKPVAVLMIGGPVDGQWRVIERQKPYVEVVEMPKEAWPLYVSGERDMPDLKHHRYLGHQFKTDTAGVIVYGHSDLTPSDVLMKLVQGYKKP